MLLRRPCVCKCVCSWVSQAILMTSLITLIGWTVLVLRISVWKRMVELERNVKYLYIKHHMYSAYPTLFWYLQKRLKSLQLNPKSSATWKTYSRMNCQMLLARSIFLRRDSYLPVLEIKQHIQMSKRIPCTFFLPAVLMIRKQKTVK